MSIVNKNNNKGFTLIELIVSIGIFTVVVIVALGAIITIIDANRKARTLTTVMNNLNFTMESMTRAIKTGTGPEIIGSTFCVMEIDPSKSSGVGNEFLRRAVFYKREVVNGKGQIHRKIYNTEASPGTRNCSSPGTTLQDYTSITSKGVNINKFDVSVYGNRGNSSQPRVFLLIEGDVEVNDKISSDFAIQTTISQRKLGN